MATLGPVTYEPLRWTPSPAGSYSRSRRSGLYQAAIPQSIADLDLPLVPTALADMEDASHDITRLDAELGGEIAPFAAVLLRSESAASSRIENLTASARSIADAELPGGKGKGKANAELIVANTAAMTAAVTLSDAVNAAAILTMHAALMGGQPHHTPGRWRTEQVWIGGGNSPLSAEFVPPSHTRVPAAIDDQMTFAARVDVPLLAEIAVAHAQFGTIHPFTDGNGRTGRAVVQAMLRNKGLTRKITVPVSAGLLADTGRYVAALTACRDGDATPSSSGSPSRVRGRPPTAGNWSPNCGGFERVGTTRSPRAPTRRCGRWRTCSPFARSSTPCSSVTNWAFRQINHAATWVRSPTPGYSSSSPTGHATAPGAHPKCSPRSMRSPSGPGDGVDGWSRRHGPLLDGDPAILANCDRFGTESW